MQFAQNKILPLPPLAKRWTKQLSFSNLRSAALRASCMGHSRGARVAVADVLRSLKSSCPLTTQIYNEYKNTDLLPTLPISSCSFETKPQLTCASTIEKCASPSFQTTTVPDLYKKGTTTLSDTANTSPSPKILRLLLALAKQQKNRCHSLQSLPWTTFIKKCW